MLPALLVSTAFFSQTKVKVDGVAVVVGENIVLDSDVQKFKDELLTKSEGKISLSDCEMLEEIMVQKLLAHQAVVDSVVVSDAEISASVDRSIAYFEQQLGSMEKVVQLYGFNDEDDLRKELSRIEKETTLIRKEKQSIVEEVRVTPEEVRVYFRSLESEGALPEFGTEIELAQLVVDATPSEEAVQKTLDKLSQIRQDVLDGSSFRMKAILYSEDPAVTQNGGKYTLTRESQFVKEFKEVAFGLDEGEISEPFASEFGYHIIQLEKVKGQEIDVRHILLQPVVTEDELKVSSENIASVRDSILAGDLSFEKAVLIHSQDKETKQNKGTIINPQTNDARFELTRMDPSLFARVSSLEAGEISEPFYDETREGRKMYKIIRVVDKIKAHQADYVKDYEKIQAMTLQKKQQEVLEKWNRDHVLETYVKINGNNEDCAFKYNWAKK